MAWHALLRQEQPLLYFLAACTQSLAAILYLVFRPLDSTTLSEERRLEWETPSPQE